MTDKTQPEALRLALSIELMDTFTDYQQEELNKAAAELRRQHARIAELEAELEAVGAGGVQALSAAPAIGDELRDTLVAVSAAIAERDDRAAQAMLREILAAPQPSTTPPADSHPAPVLLSDEELCQIEEPYLLNFRIPLGGQYDFARAVEKAVLAKTYGTQAPQPSPTPQAEQQAAPKAAQTWPSEALVWEALQAYLKHDTNMEGMRAALIVGAAPQQADPKAAPGKACVCGEPQAPGAVHRVDGPCYVAAPQQEAQEPCPSCKNSDIYACTCTFQTSRNTTTQPAPAPLSEQAEEAAMYRWLRAQHEDDSGEPRCCVYAPNDMRECLVPVGDMPGELDAFIRAALAASGDTP